MQKQVNFYRFTTAVFAVLFLVMAMLGQVNLRLARRATTQTEEAVEGWRKTVQVLNETTEQLQRSTTALDGCSATLKQVTDAYRR